MERLSIISFFWGSRPPPPRGGALQSASVPKFADNTETHRPDIPGTLKPAVIALITVSGHIRRHRVTLTGIYTFRMQLRVRMKTHCRRMQGKLHVVSSHENQIRRALRLSAYLATNERNSSFVVKRGRRREEILI